MGESKAMSEPGVSQVLGGGSLDLMIAIMVGYECQHLMLLFFVPIRQNDQICRLGNRFLRGLRPNEDAP